MKKRSTKLARQHFAELLLVACLVLSVCWIPAVGATADGSAPDEQWITETNRTGDSIIKTTNGTAYVWQGGSHSLTVNFTAKKTKTAYSVCVYANNKNSEEDRQEISCRTVSQVENGSEESVTLDIKNRKLVNKTVSVELEQTFSNQEAPLDTRTFDYQVVRRDGDLDRDGLTNQYEVEQNLNITNPDIDTDGYSDGREVNVYGTDPTDPDTDGDGIPDGAEIRKGTNANGTDTPQSTEKSSVEEGANDQTDPRNQTEPVSWTLPVRSEFVVVGLLLVGGAGVVLLWRYDERDGPSDPGEVSISRGGGDSDVLADDSQTSGDSDTGEQLPSPPSIPDDEVLLTDEDRLYELVYERSGRMKQADIVEETDWSKSKVSRLLSEMEEDGVVNKVRLGRGNVIYLEEATPDAALNPQWARDEEDEDETDSDDEETEESDDDR